MRNLEDFFGPFNPETPDELAAKAALERHFPEKPSLGHHLNRALVDLVVSRLAKRQAMANWLKGARVATDPETVGLVHEAWRWAYIARDTYERQSGPSGNCVIDGDNLFIGERSATDGSSSGLHVIGDGMVSEALMGHVFRGPADVKYLQYLSASFGQTLKLDPAAPMAIGVFTGLHGLEAQVLGVAQEGVLRGAQVLRQPDGTFSFPPFQARKVDLNWLLG